MNRTITTTIANLGSEQVPQLKAPEYVGNSSKAIGLAVASMKRHMTDEGWQIFEGLEQAGYALFGHGLSNSQTDVSEILKATPDVGVVLLQDKREWDTKPNDFRDQEARFTNYQVLKDRPDIFKVTILKDSHQNPRYHAESAEEIGCHAWVVYYNEQIVHHLAKYTRPEHLIRTYHTINPQIVPDINSAPRKRCLLSGAVSGAYPLRQRLVPMAASDPRIDYLKHPSYHRNGCQTASYLRTLSNYKIAICTSSRYGYVLRKIIEATAAGCKVLTDLPVDELVPEIEGNITRIHPEASERDIKRAIEIMLAEYNIDTQSMWSAKAKLRFNYVTETARLAEAIEALRRSY